MFTISSCINTYSFMAFQYVCLMFILVVDTGRVPTDLIEAESELIAGISTELSG